MENSRELNPRQKCFITILSTLLLFSIEGFYRSASNIVSMREAHEQFAGYLLIALAGSIIAIIIIDSLKCIITGNVLGK